MHCYLSSLALCFNYELRDTGKFRFDYGKIKIYYGIILSFVGYILFI